MASDNKGSGLDATVNLEKAAGPPDAGDERPRSWRVVAGCVVGLVVGLYAFLVGLELLGDAFKCLGGRGAGSMFTAIENPVAGLMTGVLATVMVQSSSTSTSIVVGLVGAHQITVQAAIPVIMGANIGTSVTNTIVSMGQAGDRLQLQRAFSGATVHDMFNLLAVACLLPLEEIVSAIQGQGGPLYWITEAITDALMGGSEGEDLFESPVKAVTAPVAKIVISNNKYIINALSLGEPAARTPALVNASSCATNASHPGNLADCSRYYCVSKSLDSNFKKISETAYSERLTACSGFLLEPAEPCRAIDNCYLNAGEYFHEYVTDHQIIKGGIAQGAGDVVGGIVSLAIALLLLIGGLICLCKALQILMMGKAKRVITWATQLNNYLAMAVGVAMTIMVQSSSVVTSALTPFCGLGVLTLEKMFPLTLGSNIGTTVTALLAALATFTHDAVHIALCHLFFNVLGILIWFPLPLMRRVPLGAARLLGLYASYYRLVPLIYILVAFVAVPGVCLGISALFSASVAGGVVMLLVVLGAVAGFEFWWLRMEGCYRVLSREAREEGLQRAGLELAKEPPGSAPKDVPAEV